MHQCVSPHKTISLPSQKASQKSISPKPSQTISPKPNLPCSCFRSKSTYGKTFQVQCLMLLYLGEVLLSELAQQERADQVAGRFRVAEHLGPNKKSGCWGAYERGREEPIGSCSRRDCQKGNTSQHTSRFAPTPACFPSSASSAPRSLLPSAAPSSHPCLCRTWRMRSARQRPWLCEGWWQLTASNGSCGKRRKADVAEDNEKRIVFRRPQALLLACGTPLMLSWRPWPRGFLSQRRG